MCNHHHEGSTTSSSTTTGIACDTAATVTMGHSKQQQRAASTGTISNFSTKITSFNRALQQFKSVLGSQIQINSTRTTTSNKRVKFRDQQQAYFSSASVSSIDSGTSSDDSVANAAGVSAVACTIDDAFFPSATSHMTKEQRKSICWYSDQELAVSRQDAKETIQALQRGEHMMMTTDDETNSAGSEQKQQGGQHRQRYCWRGVEKYVDAVGKVEQQRRLVGSVLHQQSIDSKADHVALVSRTLSQPFKDLARYYAEKTAQELRKELEQERQEIEQALKERQHLRRYQHETKSLNKKRPLVDVDGTLPSSFCPPDRSVKHCIRRIISE